VNQHPARQTFFIGCNVYILIGFELYLVLNAPKDLDLVSFLLQTIVFFIFAIELAVPSPPPLLRCPRRPPPPPPRFHRCAWRGQEWPQRLLML
jgi:hypothetical protein